MTDTSTEVQSTTGNKALEKMSAIRSGAGILTTVQGDTMDARKLTLSAVTNAEPLNEHLDEVLGLTHVVMQAVSIKDEKDGREVDAVRTILITDDGKSFAAVSDGLVGSLRDVFGILGEPHTWSEPLPIKVVEKRGRSGYRFMKIELA